MLTIKKLEQGDEGAEANFMGQWRAQDVLTEPIIKSIMVGSSARAPGMTNFPGTWVAKILEEEDVHLLKASNCCLDGNLNMTYLALRFAGYINGVAMRHGEISTGIGGFEPQTC